MTNLLYIGVSLFCLFVSLFVFVRMAAWKAPEIVDLNPLLIADLKALSARLDTLEADFKSF